MKDCQAAPPVGYGVIDRHALVHRHSPEIRAFDPFAALSLGNGEFAFTADVTGLQTFSKTCEKLFPLSTAAHWAWHVNPFPPELEGQRLRLTEYNTHGRQVGYPTDHVGQEPLFNYTRENPHRFHLGRIAFEFDAPDGRELAPSDLHAVSQRLDLWSGRLESCFKLEGQTVQVQTIVHPDLDLVAVRISSPLLDSGRLRVGLTFPYASSAVTMAEWNAAEKHQSRLRLLENRAEIERTLDTTLYRVAIEWSAGAVFQQDGSHAFLLAASGCANLEFACLFSPNALPSHLPSFAETAEAAARHWQEFWNHGGMIELSGSSDPQAEELERRTVLSLYNTAVHCAGSFPSPETGLLCNSWYGKAHLEMHWWHSVHFAFWNRFPLFAKSMDLYGRILPLARETARSQGYRGARWPKMIGPDGINSPSFWGPLLVWQQLHPVYYAELFYRHNPTRETLEKWRDIVFDSAEFMTSFAFYDEMRGEYVLGPPIMTVSENNEVRSTQNPLFELTQWRAGLRLAQTWRKRLGLAPHPEWEKVRCKLAANPQAEGRYLMHEGLQDTYAKWNWEHPALVGALGMLPGDGIDLAVMRETVRQVAKVWQWDRAWGWDFGMMAMACARSDEPELAVRALLVDSVKNRYWPNGHNFQMDGLSSYLPGNGSFLSAMALMAAGWEGGPETHAPGFPSDGRWQVKCEEITRWW